MKKSTFRLLSLFVVMFTMSQPSQASSALREIVSNWISTLAGRVTYHAAVTVCAVGEGKVYVSEGNTVVTPSDEDWKVENYAGSDKGVGATNSNPQTFQLYAKANDGYTFVGWWYKNENCTGNAESTANPYAASVTVDTGSNMNSQGENSKGIHKYYAKFVRTTVPVSVADYDYSTFCSDKALDFEGSTITVYYITANGTKLTYNPITKVPANTGVLLYKAGGGNEEIPVLIGTPEATTGNVLIPGSDNTVVTWTSTDRNYILYNHPTKGVGFFGANNSPVPSNRAYIHLDGNATVKSFVINPEDDATGIEEIENAVEDGAIYNMAGQRINKMQKGINIVNGKKILKK